MPNWISKLISNFTTNPLSETSVHYIQQHTPLYIHISTEGSRTNTKSGGRWTISLSDGTAIVSGWNSDFVQMTDINSHHSERYASVASLTFLERYCNNFSLRLLNHIEEFCDNKSYVTKLNELKSNAYYKLLICKIKEHEAYLALLDIPLKHLHLTQVKEHQDDFKNTAELTTPEQLNIEDDIIATSKVKPPLNIPLPSVPLAIYVNQKYIHLNFQQRIRESCFENEAKIFL